MPPEFHFGPLKKDRRFLMHRYGTLEGADKAFYESYDPLFLARKAGLLYAMYKNAAALIESSRAWDTPIPSSEEELLTFLATELHCTVFHQTEALIALILAEYQDKPDWVYLTTYSNSDVKEAAKAIATNKQVPGTTAANMKELVETAVYATWDFSKSDDISSQWKEAIQSTIELLQIVSEQFVEAHEYNSYKHGLRVVLGSARFGFGRGDLPQNFVTITSMPHAMTFLQVEKLGEDYGAHMVTKEAKPEYSFAVATCLGNLVSAIKTFRLARIEGKLPDEVLLPMFDTRLLDRTKPVTKVGFSY